VRRELLNHSRHANGKSGDLRQNQLKKHCFLSIFVTFSASWVKVIMSGDRFIKDDSLDY
jgi:hypothetical protein